ncbi:MAG: hypothetical protein R3E95_23680, partial [Thiolinea sp.]
MAAFLEIVFSFPTLVFSILLLVIMLYWLVALLGMMELDILDGDADLDSETEGGFFASWLSKFKLDGLPLTIILSAVTLVSWVLCVLAVHFIYPQIPESWVQMLLGGWLLAITPVVAALLVAPLLQPLKPFFRKT